MIDREDGVDGDPAFNPEGVTDTDTTDYMYSMPVPRITKGTNVEFNARVDGSANNVLMRLDGGMDLNGETNVYGDLRDNPPAVADDIFLGFEGVNFEQRIWPEKFAAADSVRNQIGSAGAETYEAVIGTAGFSTNLSTASNDWDGAYTVAWIWHDPNGTQDRTNCMGCAQFWPMLTNAAGQTLYINVKTPKVTGNRVHIYYTTNGTAWPEGAGGGAGNRSTRVVEATWSGQTADSNDWWEIQVPALSAGTVFRYKIGSARQQGYDGNGWDVVWPGSASDVARKVQMMGEWETDPQDLTAKSYHKHNDYNSWTTGGLPDGLHLLTVRAFLERDGRAAVYNTFRQTVYLDTETPQGVLLYPSTNDTSIGGSEYGFILKTDSTVRDVWYHIEDVNSGNDGAGNGLNTNGVVQWAQASSVTPWSTEMCLDTEYPNLWRFNYSRIPASNSATVRIRLREWSSSATNTWSSSNPALDNPTNGHFTQIERTLDTYGDPEDFFYEWPSEDGTMVEAGWQLRIRYTARMASGLSDQEIFDRVKVYVNASANGSTNRGELIDAEELNFTNKWEWGTAGEGLNTLGFDMPNVYNGQDGWLYGVRVEFTNSNGYGTFNKAATRLVQHRGPLLPTILITTPPETDSDGAKYIIEMADVPASVMATNPSLRQTPIILQTDAAATNTSLIFSNPPGYSATNAALQAVATNGDSKTWTYAWTVTNDGAYRFNATVWADTNGTEFSAGTNSATRNATIRFQELVSTSNTNDMDWDDDGIVNTNENTGAALPATTDESWTQNQVFAYHSTGKSRDDSPDSDGDGLPDGLELGVRWPVSGTDTNTDSNGDGWRNFLPDLDPPFYNTLDNDGDMPDIDAAGTGAYRAKRVQGSATDPANADTDYDGIPDGVEDENHNGWVDGDGESLPTSTTPGMPATGRTGPSTAGKPGRRPRPRSPIPTTTA